MADPTNLFTESLSGAQRNSDQKHPPSHSDQTLLQAERRHARATPNRPAPLKSQSLVPSVFSIPFLNERIQSPPHASRSAPFPFLRKQRRPERRRGSADGGGDEVDGLLVAVRAGAGAVRGERGAQLPRPLRRPPPARPQPRVLQEGAPAEEGDRQAPRQAPHLHHPLRGITTPHPFQSNQSSPIQGSPPRTRAP